MKPGRMTAVGRRGGFLFLAAACLTAAAVWQFAIAGRWSYRIPRDWKNEMRYIGSQTNADPVTGIIPAANALAFYQRRIGVLSDSGWPRSVVLLDEYRVVEHGTNKTIFLYITSEKVDPRTGIRLDEAGGDFAVFPRNVEKKTYFFSSNYLKHIPVSYERSEPVDDIDTYVFSYRGPAEYTEAYLGSADFPGVPVPAGREVRCADDQFFFRVWVEPVTGEIVQLEEGCPSGDYIVDRTTGKLLEAIDRWDGHSEGNVERTAAVRAERTRVLWGTRYLPLVLLAAAGMAAAAGFWPRPGEAVA